MVSIILHMLIILSIVCIVLLLVVCAHVGSVILNIRGYELWKMLRCGCFVKKSFWYYTNRHMNSAQVDSYRDSCPQTANTPNILGLHWRLTRARCSLMSDFSHLLLVLNSSVNIIIYGWKDAKFRELLLKLLNCHDCWRGSPALLTNTREMTEVTVLGLDSNRRNKTSESSL